jgi:hypothetical protein
LSILELFWCDELDVHFFLLLFFASTYTFNALYHNDNLIRQTTHTQNHV